eukprot:TRINITY_DN4221_c0_g1_i1.p1 TRINITY_DN4221_c0_g1~~TRINITY_DN4221_c0_g1_i1.p1  ORF type:complete len:598 (+),score=92.95 TRINITY_DN4221_c0_g1_i1:115-1908(+)
MLECADVRPRSQSREGEPTSARGGELQKTLAEHGRLIELLQARLEKQESALNSLRAQQSTMSEQSTPLQTFHESIEALEQFAKRQDSRTNQRCTDIEGRVTAMQLNQIGGGGAPPGFDMVQNRLENLEHALQELRAVQQQQSRSVPAAWQQEEEGLEATPTFTYGFPSEGRPAPVLHFVFPPEEFEPRQPENLTNVWKKLASPVAGKPKHVEDVPESSPLLLPFKEGTFAATGDDGEAAKLKSAEHDEKLADASKENDPAALGDHPAEKLQAAEALSTADAPLALSEGSALSKEEALGRTSMLAENGDVSGTALQEDEGVAPTKTHHDKPMYLEEALNFGSSCYPLPPSTYTTALLDCVISARSTTSCEWLGRSYRAYFLHVLNVALQLGCIWLLGRLTLWQWNNMELVDCYELEPVPLMCCIFCFLCTIINEVEECEDMITILVRIMPTTTVTTPIKFVFDHEGYLHHDFSEGGMSVYRKVFLLIIVILPRFLIALAVMVVGSLYVAMSTSNTEMLLNCVALVFILDIDDLLFKTLASNEKVRILNSMPVFESDEPPSCSVVDWQKTQSVRRLFFGLLLTGSVFLVVPKCQRPLAW